jgi:hypothetical protein
MRITSNQLANLVRRSVADNTEKTLSDPRESIHSKKGEPALR